MIMLKESKKKQPDSSVVKLLEALESHTKLLAFIFGLCFVGILLALAVWFPQPTAFQYTLFRITLALAAAGVAGVIPGMIRLKFQPNTMLLIHAGGALAVFVIVYFIAPAALRSELPAPTSQQNNGGVNQTINNSQIGMVINTVNKFGLTKEQYEEGQKKLLDDLAAKLQNADAGQRILLERQLQDVQEKLADTEKSYKEKLQLLQETVSELDMVKGKLPEARLDKAKTSALQGDTEEAEQVFDSIDEESGRIAAQAAFRSGRLAEDRLDYAKALRKYKRAVALEENNPEYLLAAGRIAGNMGEYKQAEDWFSHLLKIREVEKKDHEIVDTINRLALSYYFQSKHTEAEPLYKRALAILEKMPDKDHLLIAATLNNLAGLYRAEGKYTEAEPLHKRALEITEKIRGKEDTLVATCLNNIAVLYEVQGNNAEAERMFRRSIEIREQKLGKDHPDVAKVMMNLAGLYMAEGKYTEAEPLYKRALEIMKKRWAKKIHF